jgi:hypothetical protein
MSNSVDWDEIPEDVEAIVLFNHDVPSYYKMIDGVLHVQCYRGDTYEESTNKDYSELQHSEGSALHYRPSESFSPSQIKFLHETTDMLYKMINTVESKQPSINDILQEAQQTILQHHNINGKVTFTVTTE